MTAVGAVDAVKRVGAVLYLRIGKLEESHQQLVVSAAPIDDELFVAANRAFVRPGSFGVEELANLLACQLHGTPLRQGLVYLP